MKQEIHVNVIADVCFVTYKLHRHWYMSTKMWQIMSEQMHKENELNLWIVGKIFKNGLSWGGSFVSSIWISSVLNRLDWTSLEAPIIISTIMLKPRTAARWSVEKGTGYLPFKQIKGIYPCSHEQCLLGWRHIFSRVARTRPEHNWREYFISRLTQVFSTSNICIPSSVCFASAVLNTLGHTVTIKNQT